MKKKINFKNKKQTTTTNFVKKDKKKKKKGKKTNGRSDNLELKRAVQKLKLPLENRKFNELLMACNARSSKLFVS